AALFLPDSDESRHLLCRAGEIGHVVDAFAGAAEVARRAMLQDITARRDHLRARQQFAAEIEELHLVAAGAVEHEQQRTARFPAGRPVDVAVPAHGQSPIGWRWLSR